MTQTAHYPGIPAPMPACPAAQGLMLGLVLAGTLAACAGRNQISSQSPSKSSSAPRSAHLPSRAVIAPANPAAAHAVLMRAIGLVGTPYRYGGNTPGTGFDCSGLVNYVFRDILDLQLPRSSSALAEFQGPRIRPQQLAAADLVFFGAGGRVTHVGIYVGEGRFVHAPSSGGTVRLDHLDGDYWREHYSGAKRIVE